MEAFDGAVAEQLAGKIQVAQDMICRRVALRMLATFPELTRNLNLEGGIAPETRLNQMSVEPFCKLVQGVLIFETPELVDQELSWASGVLPRYEVVRLHLSTMTTWFFEEVYRLELDDQQLGLAHQLEQYMLDRTNALFNGDERPS